MQKGARNAALSFLSASVASTGDEKAGCRLTTSVISVEQGTEIRFMVPATAMTRHIIVLRFLLLTTS